MVSWMLASRNMLECIVQMEGRTKQQNVNANMMLLSESTRIHCKETEGTAIASCTGMSYYFVSA